jgi:hypothetical protein
MKKQSSEALYQSFLIMELLKQVTQMEWTISFGKLVGSTLSMYLHPIHSLTPSKYIQANLQHKFRIGVVVQANNEEDYLAEFKKYNEDPDVAVIGLSYLAISHSIKYKTEKDIPKSVIEKKKNSWSPFTHDNYTQDRIMMLKKIIDLKLPKYKAIHLLGLGESYEDLLFAKDNCPYCRYNDTSTCYMAGRKGISLPNNLVIPGGKIREKINIQEELSGMREALVKVNIEKVKENICKSIQMQL